MNPLLWEYINFALPYDFEVKTKNLKSKDYYKDIPKDKRKKIGTGIYRNGREIMKPVGRETNK